MTLGISSRGILRIPHLEALVGDSVRYVKRWDFALPAEISSIAGWGSKASALRARRLALKNGKPYVALEDGFLRSMGLGVDGAAPISLVRDEVGIYYDATRPSALERLVAAATSNATELADARRAIELITRYRLSKYNHAPIFKLPPRNLRLRVLIVDQTWGDMSLVLGGASPKTFEIMLESAKADFPDAELWIKTHPDVLSGKKRGHLDQRQANERTHFLAEDSCPLSLIEQFDHVYVATSQMGFEALLLGKSVTCFGQPWYSGWGLTDDRHPEMAALQARRPGPRTLEQLFGAAYFQYARYVKPTTGKPATLFDVIEWLARNKSINEESRGVLYCVGMSRWKRAVATPFLRTPSSRIHFVPRLNPKELNMLPGGARLVVWGSREVALCEAAVARGISVLRLEDGFVRSAGLGSDLHAPLSLVVDDGGIYYDPKSDSKLERLLANCNLDDKDRKRAARIRETLIRLKVSKYNVGISFTLSKSANGRKILLVPGQVEDDASIRKGSPSTFRNLDLLAAVRVANPNAWILYKPHPDVVAGNRPGRITEVDMDALADEIVGEASIADCIAAADEVHTMTSQAGFEALLAGKTVHCYGAPFYAGWGLTIDHLPIIHRNRRLSIDELVFVTLCQYPRYRLPGIDGFCAVEDVVQYLVSRRQSRDRKVGSNWFGRQWRKAKQLIRVFAMGR
ncbi:capsular polysaccharide biosynthesis protein [Cupriavidus alkaliphilus]|uniref:capsular polysaccharide biosynthesis protein n=1 Tax=Cupriavidus alkaliphilus TaxID=942866 RepID=UPI00161D4C75|nr:capsular polysaccharide biosynthesis protein [Cupriavidus alkaliphilus]MBB2917260.1 capsular polysaccharide export protein [Cupriavidus alkaliphilus]